MPVNLTPAQKEKLEQIGRYTELYHVLKHLRVYEDLFAGPIPPIPPWAVTDKAGLAGYTPDPDAPWPPRWPWPWPWPWWREDFIDPRAELREQPIDRIGRTLGDPNPQPDLGTIVKSPKFHREAAERALEALENARSELKESIARLDG